MVADVLAETGRRVEQAGVSTIDEVRAAGRALAGFSEQSEEEERALKSFLYQRLYNSPALIPVRDEAQRVIANLAAAYRSDPGLLPQGWQRSEGETGRMRAVGDYIAGMTDRFAIARHEELIGPVELPDRF
jgi:dGTPase